MFGKCTLNWLYVPETRNEWDGRQRAHKVTHILILTIMEIEINFVLNQRCDFNTLKIYYSNMCSVIHLTKHVLLKYYPLVNIAPLCVSTLQYLHVIYLFYARLQSMCNDPVCILLKVLHPRFGRDTNFNKKLH